MEAGGHALTFPLLPVRDICWTLAELDVTVTEDELINPRAWKVRQIFENLLDDEHICVQPRNKKSWATTSRNDWVAVRHDDDASFFKACQRLLAGCGVVRDFRLQDLTEAKQLRVHLSAIINFVKFVADKDVELARTRIESRMSEKAQLELRLL